MPCPDIISDYNTFMGGVDLADQVMCYYAVGRKTMKWWRRVFWRMIDHAITNSYVIYTCFNASSLTRTLNRKQYRIELAKALTTSAMLMKKGPGRSSTTLSRLTGKHFPFRSGTRGEWVWCGCGVWHTLHSNYMVLYRWQHRQYRDCHHSTV